MSQTPLDTLWYTHSPVPTGLGIAVESGRLAEAFLPTGTNIQALRESSERDIREAHFDHHLPNSVRHGGNIPAIWAYANCSDTRLLGLSWSDEVQLILTTVESGVKTVRDLKHRRFGIPKWANVQIDFTRAQALRGLLTGESDSSSGDDARARLSGGGLLAGKQNGSGAAANTAQTTSATPPAATYGASLGQAGNAYGNGSQGSEQNTAFSAGGVTIQADATTNALLISAPDPLYRNLREVIDMLDQRRAQVVIESLIVEVNEDDASEFGVQWQAGNLGGKGGFGGVNLGGSGINGTPTSKTSIDVLPKGLNIGLVDGTVDIPGIGRVLDLKVLARALKSKGGTNVLSTPNLLTLDNEAASIFVGQTIPFITGSYVTGGGGTSNNPFQTVQREEVGLKLNVRPQISEGGTVKLDIYQEVSSVDTRASGDARTVTNKRAIDTSILLDDGQIMVLGGLLQDGYTQSNDAVPWLSDIPGLGALFRNESRSVNKTNLMVFLRPYIIRDSGAGRSITRNRYDFMRRAQGGLQPQHSWALPDVQAPQLPAVEKAMPGSTRP